MEFSTWLTFFAASWAISVSPGPGAIAAMSAGLNHGFRYGYVTIIGLVLGIWSQLLIVGVGLGALISASATAFTVVKWLGVGGWGFSNGAHRRDRWWPWPTAKSW